METLLWFFPWLTFLSKLLILAFIDLKYHFLDFFAFISYLLWGTFIYF